MKSTKKMILATLIGVLAIGSIGYSAVSKTSRKKAVNKTAVTSKNLTRKFSCDGYQDITVENLSTDKVKLADGYGSIYNLNSTSAASGEKYSDGNISIHMKGNDAIYTENGKDKSCTLKSTGHGSIEE